MDLLVPPNRLEESRKWFKIALETGSVTYDSQERTRDGNLVDVEIAFKVLPGNATDRKIVAANVRDITQLKYVRQGKHLESRFRGLLEAAPDAMIIIDPKGRIVLANGQAELLFGYAREELLGAPIETLVPERLRGRHEMHRFQYFNDPRMRPMGAGLELYGMRKNGTEFPVEISLSPLQTEEGPLVSSAIRDITERKQAERVAVSAAELARSNQELEQFASVASHDLQEPLRMVTSYAQLLRSRYQGKLDKDADDFFTFMVGGALRMKALIEGLLAYSRVGSAGQPLTPVDCNVALLEAVQNLSKIIEETQAEISCGELPTVAADQMQMVQLFQNLLANAVKFRGSKKPKLQISAERRDNEWVFAVSDNGIGIEHEQRERIFGVFQRLHSAEEYPGTGIGLAICKRIVERHHGRIWVESEQGRGSIFRFTFPSVRQREPAKTHAEEGRV